MDFDKTSFLVDWYTPNSGTTYARKRLSFPKSARISIDEFTIDAPLGACLNQGGEVVERPRTHSLVSSYLPPEGLPCWPSSAPPSQPTFTDCEAYPLPEHRSQSCDVPAGWRALASLGLDFVADDGAFSGPDFDWSWLDALDEQLLLSPIECFTELCWAAMIDEEGSMPPRHKKSARSCARSFKQESKPAFPAWTAKDYPDRFETSRPLVAKITLPHETYSQYLSSPSSESFVTSSPTSEQFPVHFLYTDPCEHGLRFPVQPAQTIHARRFHKKHTLAHTSSPDPSGRGGAPKSRLRTAKSTSALRIVTDACTSLTGRARKVPVAH